MSKRAFTLSEVLIILGIIGVVAAITINILINNYQKHRTVVGLKKAYNIFSNVLIQAENDYGPLASWQFNNEADFSKKYIEPYFDTVSIMKYDIYNPSKAYLLSLSGGNNKYCLKNGMCYFIYISAIKQLENGSTTYYYMIFFTDINGEQGPNRLGRDIFAFYVIQNNKKFEPCGMSNRRDSIKSGCTKDRSDGMHTGLRCGSLIIFDDWQIKNDYPW